MRAFETMTAAELIGKARAGETTAATLARYFIGRIARYGGKNALNAVADMNPHALTEAEALDRRANKDDLPLFGLPVLIKDNIDLKGTVTSAGSLALSGNIAARDAGVVRRLKDNGAVILGKTNLTEFANYTTEGMPGGYSSRGGQVKFAYNPSGDPSGSSAGSGVAMSAGLCGAAVGTDTSFSVIGCATVHGVAGLKPPVGALSQSGIVPIARTLDSAGAMTKCFSDALLLYSGMRALPLPYIEPVAPGNLRLAVNLFNSELVSERQMSYYHRLFDKLRGAGAALTEVSHPYSPHMKTIMRCEFRRDLERYLSTSASPIKSLAEIVEYYESHPESMMRYGDTLLRGALGASAADADYLAARAERRRLRRDMARALAPYDACVMTGPTNIMHFCGFPSVALPLCMGADSAPRGVILYGADEMRLYAAALTIEKYCEGTLMPALADE